MVPERSGRNHLAPSWHGGRSCCRGRSGDAQVECAQQDGAPARRGRPPPVKAPETEPRSGAISGRCARSGCSAWFGNVPPTADKPAYSSTLLIEPPYQRRADSGGISLCGASHTPFLYSFRNAWLGSSDGHIVPRFTLINFSNQVQVFAPARRRCSLNDPSSQSFHLHFCHAVATYAGRLQVAGCSEFMSYATCARYWREEREGVRKEDSMAGEQALEPQRWARDYESSTSYASSASTTSSAVPATQRDPDHRRHIVSRKRRRVHIECLHENIADIGAAMGSRAEHDTPRQAGRPCHAGHRTCAFGAILFNAWRRSGCRR